MVHVFKKFGRIIAVDSNRLSFFETDELASKIIKLMNTTDDEQLMIDRLKYRHKKGEITAKIKELKRLKENNLLFTEESIYSDRAEDNGKINLNISGVVLNIINRCNLKCIYCWSHGGEYNGSHAGEKMDENVAYKAVDLMVQNSKDTKLRIDFYGGEPLLNFDLIKKTVEYCKSKEKIIDKKFVFKVNTNGILLTKDVADYLFENGIKIFLSIDGPPDVHDKARPFPNGKGSFQRIIRNFNSLPDRIKESICAKVTVTPLNVDIVQTVKYLSKIGFRQVIVHETTDACFNPTSFKEPVFFKNKEDIEILKRSFLHLYQFYLKELIKNNILYSKIFFHKLAELYFHPRKRYFPCSAGRTMLAIDVNGDVCPCIGFLGSGYKMGNVFDGVDMKIPRMLARNPIIKNAKCKRCWVKYICGGGASCYSTNISCSKNILTIQNKHCEMYKYLTELNIGALATLAKEKPSVLKELAKYKRKYKR